MARPDVKARHAAATAAGRRRAMDDPAKAEAMRESGRRVGQKNFWRTQDPEVRARAAQAIRRNHLSWCPEPYWPLNARLKSKGLLLAERQEIIAAEIAAAEQARLASMTPLERQLERVRAGATVTEKFTPRTSDHAFTLGGVASGLL